ncbi:MAG TPA: creatininase family protein [Candidatus Sulfotelmatobacter sp.]|nr:creatininase family protein [Candidatus Sulfotelmatobacter sp.]
MQAFISTRARIASGLLLLGLAGGVSAQTAAPLAPPPITPPMLAPEPTPPPSLRTHYFTSLSNVEVEKYLQYNDLIFIPIGNVQAHGVLPVDCEYVAAEALALKLAEEANALVFPNLQFTYPGDGMIGRGTVQVSSTQAIAYLKPIARSLLRQGFKRQIYITVGNAAGPETVSPLALEFFYETRTPALYLEGDILLQKVKADLNKVFFGAYSIVGRLDDIPVNLTPEVPKHAIDQGLRTLQALKVSGGARNGTVGFFGFEDESGAPVEAVTAERRAAWAKEGSDSIDAAVKLADIKKIAQSLQEHDRFTREYLIPKFDGLLP